jgi:hypothetical protein
MPVKPSDKEEEYFIKLDLERREKINEEKLRRTIEEEKLKLKKLHYMHCPKCGMGLHEIDYNGIKIDKCSACSGIWLDAGELETILKLNKVAFDRIFTLFKK